MIAGLRTTTLANEGRKLEGGEVVHGIELFGGFVRFVREIGAGRRPRPAVMVVVHVVSVVVDRMSDYLVALVFVGEQFLQADDQADDQGDLADHEGLESDQSQGAESDRDEGGSLQFQEQQDRQQGLDDLLLLAAS